MSKMSIEEIQDVLANFETRLLELENSLPFAGSSIGRTNEGIIPPPATENWTPKMWDIFNQSRAEVKHLHEKWIEFLKEEKEQRDKKHNKKYTKYG